MIPSAVVFKGLFSSPKLMITRFLLSFLFLLLSLVSCKNQLVDEIELIRQIESSPQIVVTLNGDSTLEQGSVIDCEKVSVGSTNEITINIRNNGKKPLIIDLATMTLTMSSETEENTFTVVKQPSKQIDVDNYSKLIISFNPVSGGSKSASLSISTNDFNNPVINFSLTGEGWNVVLTTNNISNIEKDTATGGGEIVSDGGNPVTDRGICWGTQVNPTINDNYISAGSTGLGSYSILMTGLNAGTLYYVRAYANNGTTTGYGTQTSFTTKPAIPGTPMVSPIGYPSGSGKLDISWSSLNGSSTYYDVYYNTTTTPPGSANGPTNILQTSCTLTGLVNYQDYYVWVKAKNSTASSDLSEPGTSMVGVKVSGIVWDKTPQALVNGTSETISAYCLPANATDPTITWSSSNAAVATVTAGVVNTIASSGSVTIESKDSLGNIWKSVPITANDGANDSPGPAGGKIFYDAGNYDKGWRYLEVANENIGANHSWYNGSYINIPTAYSHAMGAGKENTDAIIAAQGSGNYMAMDCHNYVINGYTDFYMPSAGEVNEILVVNQDSIFHTLTYFGANSSSQTAFNGSFAYTAYYGWEWGTLKTSVSNSQYITWPVRRF